MTLKFTKDGKAHYSAVFEDTDGQLKAQNATCNSVLSLLEQQSSQSGGSAAILKKFNIEDISAGGNLKCKLTQKRAEVSTSLSKEGNGYVLRLAGDPRFSKLSGNKLGGDLTFKIVMPGKITEASGGGQIEGNTVTYTGLSQLANSLVIKSDATGGSGDAPSSDDADSSESPSADSNNADGEESATSDDSSSDENASNDSDSSDSDGFPTWAWYAIGAGVLLLLGIIIFAVRRSKRKNSDTFDAAGPYTGAFGGPQRPALDGMAGEQGHGPLQVAVPAGGSVHADEPSTVGAVVHVDAGKAPGVRDLRALVPFRGPLVRTVAPHAQEGGGHEDLRQERPEQERPEQERPYHRPRGLEEHHEQPWSEHDAHRRRHDAR